jgi:hypothetical protein
MILDLGTRSERLLARLGRFILEEVQSQSQSHIATANRSVSLSWCRAPSGAHDQIFILD